MRLHGFTLRKRIHITYYHIIYSTRSYMSPHMLIWLFIITGSYLHTTKNIAQINSSNICWLFKPKLLLFWGGPPSSTIPPKRLLELFDLFLAARSSGRRMFHVFLSVLFYGFPWISDSLRDRVAPLRSFLEFFPGRKKMEVEATNFASLDFHLLAFFLFRVWNKV